MSKTENSLPQILVNKKIIERDKKEPLYVCRVGKSTVFVDKATYDKLIEGQLYLTVETRYKNSEGSWKYQVDILPLAVAFVNPAG